MTIGDIVGAFKSVTTNNYIHGVKQSGWNLLRNVCGSRITGNISSAKIPR
jgi:hypothetical protein